MSQDNNPRHWTATLTKFWTWLTEPAASIQEPGRRQQARLLAALLVCMIPLTILAGIVTGLAVSPESPVHDPLLPVGIGAAVVLVTAYWLNRSGRQEMAALLAIAVINLGVYGLLINGLGVAIVDPEVQVQFLMYVMLPVLFASALLRPRHVAVVIAVNLGIILVLPLFYPELTYSSITFGPLSFILIASSLVLVAGWHRRRIEQGRRVDLAEKEERYRGLLETAFEGVAIYDGETLVDANEGFARMAGYDLAEMIGMPAITFVAEQARDQLLRDIQAGSEQTYETLGVRKDGTTYHAEMILKTQEFRGRTAQIAAVRDVTERQQLQQTLNQYNNDLQSLNQAGHALNVSLNLDEVLTRTLEWACQLLNTDACSVWLLDSESGELVCRGARGPQREAVEGWRLARGQGVAGWVIQTGRSLTVADTQTEARHFKGIEQETGLVLCSLLAVPLQVKGDVIGVLEVLDWAAGRFDATDQTLLESLVTSAAIALENAQLYAKLQQRMRELQLAQTHLVQSSRMAAVGELAAGVAHELNNPLLGVLGYAELLLERTPADHPDRQRLEAIFRQAGRVRDIVRNLMSFAQQTVFRREPADLNRVVQRAVALIRLRLRTAGIAVEEHYAPDLPDLPLDAGRMQQVVLNLLTNAFDAMPEGGRLAVRTERDGQEAMVHVADTGVGIPDELRARIFEPFFSTKPVGKGTGLGLAVSLGIVQDHGGRIEVESIVGDGSTFTISLPLEPLPETE